jgi:hypothetical protein
MAQAFKAIIVIDDGNVPAHPIAPGGPPPEVWPGPGYPAHPIAPGGGPSHPIVIIPPDSLAPGVPSHPIYLPVEPAHPIAPGGQPPFPSQGPGFPTPPIYIPPGGQPPTVWPGPGVPTHPIVIPPDAVAPGVPTHPIVLPPPVVWPGPGYPAHPIAPGGQPPGIWGGGNVPMPTPPIYIGLPPGEQPPPDGNGNSPAHPIVLPPDVPPDPNSSVLVHCYVAGHGGAWFLVNTAHVGGQPPTPQPKK